MTGKSRALHKATLAVALLVLFALVCHIVARRVEIPELSRFINFIRTSVFIGIFAVWGVSAERRVVQPQIRRFLKAVAILMLFWMILRELKFRFVIDISAERYMWYFYYVPILLTPLIALFVSILLGKNESYRLSSGVSLLYIPAFLLIAAFLTNDLHQLAFRFSGMPWSEHVQYSYGPVFYAAIAWSVFCSVAAVIIMLSKSRLTGHRFLFLYPLLLVAVIVLYTFAYSSGVPLVSEIDDVAAFYGIVFISFFEICIRVGLIPSNTRYFDLFIAARDLSLQITDNDYNVRYAADPSERMSREDLLRAEKAPVILGGKRLHSMPVCGGHAVWTEDVSELLELTEELRRAHSELNDRNEIVQMEYEDERQRRTIEVQNQLYDRLHEVTQTQLSKASALTDLYVSAQGEEEKRRIISKIIVLGSYIKRRKGLLLSIEEGGCVLDWSSLESALGESFRSLKLLGISGTYSIRTESSITDGEVLTRFYDFFEDVLESVMDDASILNIIISPVNGTLRCSVLTDCTGDYKELLEKYPGMKMTSDPEDGTQFMLSQGDQVL